MPISGKGKTILNPALLFLTTESANSDDKLPHIGLTVSDKNNCEKAKSADVLKANNKFLKQLPASSHLPNFNLHRSINYGNEYKLKDILR